MRKVCFALAVMFLFTAAQAGVGGLLRQGGAFYNDQKYGSALNSYNEILKNNPNDQYALFNAGNAYYRLNEYTQAQQAYEKAAEVKGEMAQDALFNLGNAYYRAGDKEKAKESFKKVILNDPKDKEAIHNLQLILAEEQQQNENQNNNNNQNQNSDNQNKQNNDGKGQNPQDRQEEQDQQNMLDKSAADRVMSMAKENEYRRTASSNKQQDNTVEKDW